MSRQQFRSNEPMSDDTLRDVIERVRRSVCGEYWVESLSRDDQHLIDEYGAGCRVYSLTVPGRFTWSKACETDFSSSSERGLALIKARNKYKALQSQYRAALYWLQFKGLLRRQGETLSSWQERIRHELEPAMQREEQLLREEQASDDTIGRPHNALRGWWISWELAADAIRLFLKRSVGQAHETLKEAANSGENGVRELVSKKPLHVFGIDDDLLWVEVEYYPNGGRGLWCERDRSDVEIDGDDLLDWVFRQSIAESPPATDNPAQDADGADQSNVDEPKSLARRNRAGRSATHDWEEATLFFRQQWERRGDPRLPGNKVKGWKSDSDIGKLVRNHLEKHDKEQEPPDFSTVMKHLRSLLRRIRENKPN
jgi:hypothetical protein